MNTITLYRPVGLTELLLIKDSGFNRFPPRLEWQPIFYPVLNEAYAVQIAREWNTDDAFSGYLGAVTAFSVDAGYLLRYEVQNVGANLHNELWIPAAELSDFNRHILGQIKITRAFFGKDFVMPEDEFVASMLDKFQKNE